MDNLLTAILIFAVFLRNCEAKPVRFDGDYGNDDLLAEESRSFAHASGSAFGGAATGFASSLSFGGFGYGVPPKCHHGRPHSHGNFHHQLGFGPLPPFPPHGFGHFPPPPPPPSFGHRQPSSAIGNSGLQHPPPPLPDTSHTRGFVVWIPLLPPPPHNFDHPPPLPQIGFGHHPPQPQLSSSPYTYQGRFHIQHALPPTPHHGFRHILSSSHSFGHHPPPLPAHGFRHQPQPPKINTASGQLPTGYLPPTPPAPTECKSYNPYSIINQKRDRPVIDDRNMMGEPKVSERPMVLVSMEPDPTSTGSTNPAETMAPLQPLKTSTAEPQVLALSTTTPSEAEDTSPTTDTFDDIDIRFGTK